MDCQVRTIRIAVRFAVESKTRLRPFHNDVVPQRIGHVPLFPGCSFSHGPGLWFVSRCFSPTCLCFLFFVFPWPTVACEFLQILCSLVSGLNARFIIDLPSSSFERAQ